MSPATMVIGGIIALMVLFMAVLGGTALLTRD
jgi:hypothetical protein